VVPPLTVRVQELVVKAFAVKAFVVKAFAVKAFVVQGLFSRWAHERAEVSRALGHPVGVPPRTFPDKSPWSSP